MPGFNSLLRFLVTGLLAGMLQSGIVAAAEEISGFGKIAIPSPAKPVNAEQCVEPVEIMRRDHMKFLLDQRDATVIDGERGSKYSLVGCMDCHNPADASEEIVRYEDPEHFCADCHRYASVKIDCFECHADRGLSNKLQSRWYPEPGSELLTVQTFRHKLEQSGVD